MQAHTDVQAGKGEPYKRTHMKVGRHSCRYAGNEKHICRRGLTDKKNQRLRLWIVRAMKWSKCSNELGRTRRTRREGDGAVKRHEYKENKKRRGWGGQTT